MLGLAALTTAVSPSVWAVTASPSPTPVYSPKVSPSPSSKNTTTAKTASPTPIATSSADTTLRLKERIDKVIEQRKAEVKGVVDQLSSPRKGFIGQVQRVTEKTISLKTRHGNQILNITDEVVMIKDGKKITINEVAIDDWAVAMGFVNGTEFVPQRLLFTSKSLEPTRSAVAVGSIESITSSKLVLSARQGGSPTTLTLTKTTQFQDQTGKTLTRDKVPTQVQVVAIYTVQDTTQTAGLIRLLVPLNN